MSRKFSLIPLGIIVLVGAVWASSSLFPDKPLDGFASLPTSPGTLGHVLEGFFDASGNANNALNMAGQPANTYLRGDACVSPNVWKGTDASGKIICGTKIRVLAQVGRITAVGGSVTVITEDGATSKAAVVGDILKEGARVQTAGGGSATVTFTDDLSIVRLDQNTRIDIKLPETTSPTSGSIASVIVSNGVIWGRVLTTDGVEFGGGGLIAGVRGTSIRMDRFNWSGTVPDTFRISIVHSRTPTNAAIISTSDGQIVTTAQAGENYLYAPISSVARFKVAPDRYVNSADATIEMADPVSDSMQGLTYFYGNTTSSKQIKSNVLQDITYLKSKRDTLPTSPAKTIVQEELAATVPTTEPARINLCNTGAAGTSGYWYGDGQYGCVYAYADMSTSYDLKWLNGLGTWEALAVKDITNLYETYSADKHPRFKDGNWIGFNNANSEGGNPFNNPTSGSYKYTNLYEGILAVGGPANTNHYNAWYGSQCSSLSGVTRVYCQLVLENYRTPGSTIGNLYQGAWVQTNRDFSHYQYETRNGTETRNWDNSGFYSIIRFISGYQFRATGYAGATYNLNPETLNINQSGRYLTYVGNTSALQGYLTTGNVSTSILSQLAGKTITIELANATTIDANSRYLLDLGGVRYYFNGGILWQRIGVTTPTNIRTISTSDRIFDIPIPTGITIDRFIIGNNSATNYINPLNNQVQKIIIK